MPRLTSRATAAPSADLPNDDPTVTDDDLCSRFGMLRRHLRDLVKRGCFPAPDVRLSRRLWRWRPSTIQRWMASQAAGRKEVANV